MNKNDLFNFAATNARIQFARPGDDDYEPLHLDSPAPPSESQIHAKATELRSQMDYADFMDALNNVSHESANAILTAVLEYDHAALGDLMSREVQEYFRRVAQKGAEPEMPRMLLPQAD